MHATRPLAVAINSALLAIASWCFAALGWSSTCTQSFIEDYQVIVRFKDRAPLVKERIEGALYSEEDAQKLAALAKMLRLHQDVRVHFIGYSDPTECKRVDCKRLSERRASSVLEWLRNHEVSSVQLEGSEGKGATDMVDSSLTEAQRLNNRRTEFEFTFSNSKNK